MATTPPHSPKIFTIPDTSHLYTNSDRPMSVDDDFDCVRVEISDLDNACSNQTALCLLQCKKRIVDPFRKLLCLIGWRPFGADQLKRPSYFLRTINILYPIFLFLVLLFNYAYEVAGCQGKLNVQTDTGVTSTTSTTTTTPSGNQSSMLLLNPAKQQAYNHEECGHIVTTYIFPDIFHCLAFIFGLTYFRITEGEALYSLMEKVFISAAQNVRVSSTNRVIRRLNIFMLISCAWMILSVATVAFSDSMNINNSKGYNESSYRALIEGHRSKFVFLIVDIICRLVSHSIYLAVVINYVCHCEMIVFYCKTIRLRLEEKSIHLLESMKRIVDLAMSISQLNSQASRMMSLLIIVFFARTILGTILLIANRVFKVDMWIYRCLYVVVWSSILAFCLGLASRVTNKCTKFRRIALSMRVYGYHNATTSELDGFLLFLSQADLRVKLFGLSLVPGRILTASIAAFLVIVVLFQTSLITKKHFWF